MNKQKNMVAWNSRGHCDPLGGCFSGRKAMGEDQGTSGRCAGTCNGHNGTVHRCNSDRCPLPSA